MKVTVEKNGEQNFVVSAHYDDDRIGTSASVYAERGWLFIVTDDYEGVAMLHLEAIDKLIDVLTQIKERYD